MAVQITGAFSNYVVYAVVLVLLGHTPENAQVALAIGSLVGMVMNFTGARHLAFSTAARPKIPS